MDNKLGEMGGLCPLFFDGAICRFDELPKPNDTDNLNKVYDYLNSIRSNTAKTFLSYSKRNSNKLKTLVKTLKRNLNGKNFSISKIRIW